MKMSIVLNFDVPIDDNVGDPRRGQILGDAAADLLRTIDPPHLAHFTGDANVVIDPYATNLAEWLQSPLDDPADLAILEKLVRDFDHYANQADPSTSARPYLESIYGHLLSIYMYATKSESLRSVVDELDRHDRHVAAEAIRLWLTSEVGKTR